MKRWFLTTLLGAGLLAPVYSDDPSSNPFRGGAATKKADDKKADDKADVEVMRVAHIKLHGEFDEAPVPEESLFGAPKENLSSIIGRIRKAAKDERVKGLYIQVGEVSCGFGKLHELNAALAEFKKTGKKIFAYGEELSAKGYLLALNADHIALPESGGIILTGMRAEVGFYKDALALLRLKVDVAKVGNYKSAVEPFLRDTMSKENREQIKAMLDDNFDNELVKPIAASRKKDAKQVEAIIDQGPFMATKAKELGLIDETLYEDQLDAAFAKTLGAKTVKIDKNYAKPKAAKLDMSNPFALMSEIMGGGKKTKESTEPKVAVIYAIGSISSGKSGSGNPLMGGESVGSETIVEAIRAAEKDDTVKCIVLRIDSPGGSALASDVMWRELSICKKPVVASMGDVAASGGYYIAMPCKKIFAEPGTITGSIGVFGMKIVMGGLEEWGGIKTEVVSRGKNSGIMSSTFPWTDSEKKAMEETVDVIYEQFTTKALAGRHAAGKKSMTIEDLKKVAGGRVWTGRQALENGLVDKLGTLEDAIKEAKMLAKIDPSQKLEVLPLPKPVSYLDKLLDGDASLPFGSLDLKAIPGSEKAIKMIAPLLATRKDNVKMLVPYYVEFK